MNKNFPDADDILLVISTADEPLTSFEVHRRARESLGLPMPHHHGTAGTMVRLQRLFEKRLVTYKLNQHGARVWFIPKKG